MENEVEDWWKEAGVETTDKSIEISGELSGSDVYVCEITSTGGYPTPNFATQSAEQV